MALTQQEASVLATVAGVVNEAMVWQKDWEQYLADRYETCLCKSCLEELIERAEAGELL